MAAVRVEQKGDDEHAYENESIDTGDNPGNDTESTAREL
jgi:hypothetical protein